MTASPSDLTAHLGYWLRYVSNHVSQAFAHKLEARGVTVAEWVLMRELYEGVFPPSRVAERLDMTRGAITKLADRLIAKGLISREANPSDARAQTLTLSKAGRKLVPELAALADRNDAEFFGHLGSRQREQLTRLLKEIVEKRGLKSYPVD